MHLKAVISFYEMTEEDQVAEEARDEFTRDHAALYSLRDSGMSKMLASVIASLAAPPVPEPKI